MVANPFGDLSVRISARTQDFTRGVNSAKESLGDLSSQSVQTSGALQVLQGRADEAGDEISSLGRAATVATGPLKAMSSSSTSLDLGFVKLGGTIGTVLIPALAALSTTLIPLAATFGTIALAATGLAGAFGLVIGSGILAFGNKRAEQNRERLRQINSQIAALEEQRQKENAVNEDQREHLRTLQARKRRLVELQATEEGLTKQQQKLLERTRENIKETKQSIQANKGLNQTEQERLQQLREKKKEVKEQTSITGALGAELKELKNSLVDVIVPFGEQFIPLIEAGIEGLPDLVENTLESIGGLDSFAEAIRDLGETAFNIIPDIASELIRLAEDSLPLLRDLGEWLLRNGPRIFREMVSTTKEIGPELLEFGRAISDALPELNRFGTLILEDVLPALSDIILVVLDAGRAVESFLAFAGRLNDLLNNWVVIGVLGGLAAVLTGPAGLVAALAAATLGYGKIEDAILGVQNTLRKIDWQSLFNPQALLDAGLEALGLTDEHKEALKILGEEIVGAISDGIDFVGSLINFFTGIPDNLAKQIGAFGREIGSILQNAINAAIPDQISVSIPSFSVAGQTFGGDTIKLDLPDNPAGGSSAAGAGGSTAENIPGRVAAQRVVSAESAGGGQITTSEARMLEKAFEGLSVQVNVEGDTDVIKNTAGEIVARSQRQQGRNAEAARTGFRN